MNSKFRLVAIAAALGCLTLTACEEEQVEVVEQVRSIKTITVAERGSGQIRRFPGVIEAVDTSTISFEVAGNTREVRAGVGDRVEEGQVLATLDDGPFRLNVEAAEAEVGRAKAQLAEKDNLFQRQDTLFQKGWVAKAAHDQAVAARDSAANEVSYAISKLNLARRDLEKTVLAAPFDAVIASRYADPFQEVGRGEKIFDLYVEGATQVVLSIPETSISDIHIGLPAQVTFPTKRNTTLDGRISEVGTVASETNAFPVKVALVDAPPEVLPGMTAEVALLLGEATGEATFLVPISAIAAGTEAGQGFIFVYDRETSTVRRVEVRGRGVQDNHVFVIEGLKGGEIIAVAGVSFLRDGQKVSLVAQ